jgi:sulfite reductase alpha subunit-like flavoprotein
MGVFPQLMESFKKLVEGNAGVAVGDDPDAAAQDVVVLYGSETGNAEALAHTLAANCKARHVGSVVCKECDETAVEELEEMAARGAVLLVVISTAGQGDFPKNSKTWFDDLCKERPEKWLSKLRFAVFGLGDSAYCHFCKAAVEVEHRLGDLGAVPILPRGKPRDNP